MTKTTATCPTSTTSTTSRELIRARRHLESCQMTLRAARCLAGRSDLLERAETNFLAALSLVWDMQERERAREMLVPADISAR
jgi:hypothetical protein